MHESEKIFAKFLENQNKHYIYQPTRFKLKDTTYRVDFYCLEDKTYYEVIGTRQAYSANKQKIIELKKIYPNIKFKIVYPSGMEYIKKEQEKSKEKHISYTLRIDPGIYEKIKNLAEKQICTKTHILRQAIKAFLDQKPKIKKVK